MEISDISIFIVILILASYTSFAVIPTSQGSIAVIGCSNTGQHATGYHALSSRDILADVTRTGR